MVKARKIAEIRRCCGAMPQLDLLRSAFMVRPLSALNGVKTVSLKDV